MYADLPKNWKEILDNRVRPNVVKDVPVSAEIQFIDDKPVVVSVELADIPVDVWDAFWQKAYRDSIQEEKAKAEYKCKTMPERVVI